MKIKTWLLQLLLAFSFFLPISCQDRLFDNPFDPKAGEIVFEVVSTILTPSYMPLSLTWDGSTVWNVDGYNETLYSLNRLAELKLEL